ncbi:hypothetical protein LXA47_10320 [Massilia sp. P8910]|uniref:DUF883 family protein n=1 Tax=Massilia antarctica TaxID=2765360 RepID=UPI0006BC7CD3|nr:MULTISPECIES: hypothetical protein [Massilia]MCE3603997.1 hypothetical protein [Massilia antarctica]MCY0911138.1 hypothetical protein [Massilia sp. H27-R4]CUI05278.1 hypothetical protein BN2497_5333 [Janthinobacterium sp. CG23_2]CUU29064.1 hypothetical protein BN3177_5333 [Janthinobacterium sp. CG23_2]
MDNQKSNGGNASNIGSEGSGSSMGKDLGAGRNDGNKGSDLSKSAADMHKTIDKAADAAQPVVDRLASSAHAGVDKVSGALNGVTGRMDEKARQLTDAYKNFAETGRDYVRTSPATSVLVALGIGYTLSKLLGRRN